MNEKHRVRPTIFVCAAVADNQLLIRMITADSPQQAGELFREQAGVSAQEILGPFYKKRTQVIENTRVLKFLGQTKEAVFNDWKVDAFLLQEPENHAYLVFIKRVDEKKATTPQGTFVVPISQLRFI